jgi:hypothetical protein
MKNLIEEDEEIRVNVTASASTTTTPYRDYRYLFAQAQGFTGTLLDKSGAVIAASSADSDKTRSRRQPLLDLSQPAAVIKMVLKAGQKIGGYVLGIRAGIEGDQMTEEHMCEWGFLKSNQ